MGKELSRSCRRKLTEWRTRCWQRRERRRGWRRTWSTSCRALATSSSSISPVCCCVLPCGTLWCFLVLSGVLWYLMVLCVPCSTSWYLVVPCGTLWYLVVRYDTVYGAVYYCVVLSAPCCRYLRCTRPSSELSAMPVNLLNIYSI